jgi:EAL domain-containing protein (putative c-di-GMP-specific phosphodiesterase class I)
VKIAIDDFGTGYSSMTYLKKLPVSTLKIDKSFVIGMTSDENDAAIVRTSIDLAHNLGLKVVAEGVESEAVLKQLKTLGCDLAQGHYLGRPLTQAELEEWLAHSAWGVGATTTAIRARKRMHS